MKKLTEKEVTVFLKENLMDWTFEKDTILRNFKLKTFVEAFSFMTAIASEAEKMNHHPNWENVYNKVNIALNTHDVGGVSLKDFELATHIDLIAKNYTN